MVCVLNADAGTPNCQPIRLVVTEPGPTVRSVDTVETTIPQRLSGRLLDQDAWSFKVGDFDADGLADVIYLRDASLPVKVYFSEGDGRFAESAQSFPAWDDGGAQGYMQQLVGDYNGDGLSDFLHYNNGGPTVFEFGRGDRTFDESSHETTLFWDDYAGHAADVNGDGFTDLISVRARDGTGGIAFSDGCGRTSATKPIECHFFTITDNSPPNLFSDTTELHQAEALEVGDFNGDGLADIFVSRPSRTQAPYHTVFINQQRVYDQGRVPLLGDLLTVVRNGVGQETRVFYKSLTSDVYSRAGQPWRLEVAVNQLAGSLYVVHETQTQSNTTTFNTHRYRYEAAYLDRHGAGFLGFSARIQEDADRGVTTRTTYALPFPTTGMPVSSRTYLTYSDRTVTQTVTVPKAVVTHQSGAVKSYFLYTESDAATTYDPYAVSETVLSHATTTSTFDAYGNLMSSDARLYDRPGGTQQLRKYLVNQYANLTGPWILGRLWCATAQNTVPGQVSEKRVSAFEYDGAHGQLTREIIEPGSRLINVPGGGSGSCGDGTVARDALTVVTDYGYDVFGERETTTLSAGDSSVPPRTSRTQYLSEAERNSATPRRTVTNALNHQTTTTGDARWGVARAVTDANGVQTSWTYDALGRETSETRVDGRTVIEYSSGVFSGLNVCPVPATVLAVRETTEGHGYNASCLDVAGRVVRETSDGAQGVRSSRTEYDALGRLYRTYRNAGSAFVEYQLYDNLDRPHKIMQEDGSYQDLIYSGNTGIVNTFAPPGAATTPLLEPGQYAHLPQTVTTHRNALGQVVGVVDAGGETNYVYRPFGELGEIRYTTQAGVQKSVVTTYDARGRKVTTRDPNSGTWSYLYYPTGEIKTQTDAKGQVTRMEYDALGRLTVRVNDDSGPARTVSRWTYDSAPRGGGTWRGALHTVTRDGSSYRQEHGYDALGRLNFTETRHADGETFRVTQEYDAHSRLKFVTYPAGGPRLEYRYASNNTPRLAEIVDTAGNTRLWAEGARDTDGNLLYATFGNGRATQWLFNNVTGQLEEMRTGMAQSGETTDGSIQNLTYRSDALGNLLLRRDNLQTAGGALTERFFVSA